MGNNHLMLKKSSPCFAFSTSSSNSRASCEVHHSLCGTSAVDLPVHRQSILLAVIVVAIKNLTFTYSRLERNFLTAHLRHFSWVTVAGQQDERSHQW